MFLSAWLRAFGKSGDRSQRRLAPGSSFRPGCEQLDDRLAPSATATHFLVVTPESGVEGSKSPVGIIALDASNHIATGYTGTVNVTASDGTIASTYTFTKADHGAHVLSETLGAVGTDTVTVTDSTTTSITGSASVSVTAAPVATHFAVVVQPQAIVGASIKVAVVALDASNHVVTNYTGTVALSSSDGTDGLPAAYTFTAGDRGVHVFTVTAGAAGADTITATDSAASSIAGSGSLTINAAPVATHFAVLVQPQAYAGASVKVAVVALDASNRIVTNYTGTVALSSSDGTDGLPAAYTFTAGDRGVHVFTVTAGAAGADTITATDSAASSIAGSGSLTINPAQVATHFAIVTLPRVSAGAATQLAVVALDASNHIVAGYTGTVQLTSSNSADVLPASYTFTASDNGVHVFTATLAAAGNDTLTATDTTTSTITGSFTVRVQAARTAHA